MLHGHTRSECVRDASIFLREYGSVCPTDSKHCKPLAHHYSLLLIFVVCYSFINISVIFEVSPSNWQAVLAVSDAHC